MSVEKEEVCTRLQGVVKVGYFKSTEFFIIAARRA